MPLGAFVSSTEIMDCLKRNPVLGHITTFGGHPVCCAAGLASFEYLLESGLHLKADEKGEQFVQRLKNIKGLKEIRRVGLLLALDWGSVEMCNRVVKKLTDAGMLTESYLFAPESMRISPSTFRIIRLFCYSITATIVESQSAQSYIHLAREVAQRTHICDRGVVPNE